MKQRDRARSAPVQVVEASQNQKLGDCSATYVSQASCPDSCPFINAGCYGELGFVGMIAARLNRSKIATPLKIARLEAAAIDRLSGVRDLRLHVVGDSPTVRGTKLLAEAASRYTRECGRSVWTYTHAWRTVPRSAWGSVSVLASCETTDDVWRARVRGYATALVVAEFHQDAAYVHEGIRVIPCPAQTRHVTCETCRLCMDDKRLHENNLTIAFAAHGSRSDDIKERISLL